MLLELHQHHQNRQHVSKSMVAPGVGRASHLEPNRPQQKIYLSFLFFCDSPDVVRTSLLELHQPHSGHRFSKIMVAPDVVRASLLELNKPNQKK